MVEKPRPDDLLTTHFGRMVAGVKKREAPDHRHDMLRGNVFIESQDRLKNGETIFLAVRPTENMGMGLFAKVDIPTGKLVFCAHGDEYEMLEFHENLGMWACHDRPAPDVILPNAICIGREIELDSLRQEFKKNIWLNPSPDNPLMYLNHCCDPNVGRSGNYAFMAMRDIKKGEQVVADYSTLEVNPKWRMKCLCGAANCRKEIGDIQTLTLTQAQSYWKFIPVFMRKIYLDGLKEKDLTESDGAIKEELAKDMRNPFSE